MKFFQIKILSAFLVLNSATISQAQEITLPKEVRFNIGDNPEWANPNFDDSHWGTKFLGKSWPILDVYAWQRLPLQECLLLFQLQLGLLWFLVF